MIKIILILAGISLTIVALYYHLKTVESEYTQQLINSPEQQHYSHQFKNFSLTNTNAKGETQSIIHSPSTRMQTAQQITFMDDPELIMQRELESPIVITAKQAQVFHTRNETLLNDNVEVVMSNSNNSNAVLKTEQLAINNQTQHAYTELPAMVIHNKGTMHGTGVEFDPHTKQINFLSEVRGIYEH